MAGKRERVIAGRYRLRQRLGSGGGGDVWLAEDEELRAQVAVKEIDVPHGPQGVVGDAVGRGRKEALKAAQLREHPNVITVYDVVEDDDRPWIVMEYLPGTRDLRAVVEERGSLASDEVARIGAAALDALRAGHRRGIIHRDVKPSNILLAPDHSGLADRRVLLTDYGISLRLHETRITESGMVVGTPGYVAPERLSGGEATDASDLFSLGVTLYCAVEGTAPFERDTLDATLMAALTMEPSLPRRASDPLSRAIMGLLAKDPADRTQAAQAGELLAEAAALPGSHSALPSTLRGATRAVVPPAGVVAVSPSGSGGAGVDVTSGGSAGDSGSGGSRAGRAEGAGEPGGGGRFDGPAESAAAAPASSGGVAAASSSDSGVAGADIASGGSASGGSGAGGSEGVGEPGIRSAQTVPPSPRPGRTPAPAPALAPPPAAPGGSGRSDGLGAATGPGPSVVSVVSGEDPLTSTRRTSDGVRRVPRWRAPLLLTLAAVLVGGGGFALGAAAFRDAGGEAHSPAEVRAKGVATPSPTVTRGAYPYGGQAGLREGLTPGQCVDADWKGGEYEGRPRLKLVDCYDDDPEGQVIATVPADGAVQASDVQAVRGECARRTAELRETMADPVLYVLTPQTGQSEPPASACLLFLKHATLGGPLGDFRKFGDEVYITQLGPGDCINAKEDEDGTYTKTLVSCAKPHDEQMVGWTWASGDGSADSVDTGGLCEEKYGVNWARGAGHEMWGWNSSDEEWDAGFRHVLCSVGREDGGKLPGGALKPAY